MASEVQKYAEQAVQILTALKEAALQESGYVEAESKTDQTDFQLLWRSAMTAAELAEEAERLAGEYTSIQETVQKGRVYCYSCQSAACTHSAPSEPGYVFTGYTSTGKPRWDELFNFLLLLNDDRTERLFKERPELVVHIVSRRQLISEQLISFGKNSFTYRIWGQLVAGYIHTAGIRAAVTVQIVETKNHKINLQIIADPRLRETLANAPEDQRSPLYRLHDALTEAQHRIASLGKLWEQAANKEVRQNLRHKIHGILRHLNQSIERKGRQHRRRTVHAEMRGGQRRPVHKAHDDLVRATDTDFFYDTVRHSIIIAGKAGRMHVYNEDGRHITTLICRGDELARRVRRKRYVPVSPDDVERLRQKAVAQYNADE